ncbi:MAG: patatin-like phospholipase family protein [Acidimicrobiales bacterium]
MDGRAVVLGGGGLSGVAWLTGVLSAFEAEGVLLAEADFVLGTSAGSVVATQLVSGRKFSHLYHFLSSPHVPLRTALLDLYGLAPKPDPTVVTEMMEHVQRGMVSTEETRAQAGAAAMTAKTMPEPIWVTLLATYIHHHHWPGPALGITTVEAETGAFRVIREADDVCIARACAASAAVPRFFPPVVIDGRHWIDGGTRSCTNADVAAGYGTVIVLVDHAPLEVGDGPLSRATLDRELAELRAGGANVVELEPNAESVTAMGSGDQLNPAHIVPSAIAGRAQGAAEVERVRAAWHPSV